jgi:hypothetical protein
MSLSLYALTLAPVSVALTGIRGTSGSNPPSSSGESGTNQFRTGSFLLRYSPKNCRERRAATSTSDRPSWTASSRSAALGGGLTRQS